MLNLRQANETSDYLHTTTHTRSTARFHANILVGNMGESLHFGTQNYDDDVEDNMDRSTAVH
jgi:hypothetical protein